MAKPKQIDKTIVNEIREIYLTGEITQKQIASRFNLSQSTVCKIINNNIHKYSSIDICGEAEVKMGYRYGN